MTGIITAGNGGLIGTDELLAIINQARAEHGENAVRNNDFIARVKDELHGDHYETFVVQNLNGTQSEHLRISNDQAVLVGMRESKLVRRTVLAILKAKQAPALPQSLPEALRLAADLAEQKEKLEVQLSLAAPKIDFVDRYVEASGALGFRETCKLLRAKETDFRDFLIQNRIMYRLGKSLTPYAQHLEAGRFVEKTGENETNGHAFRQTKFTPKGIQWIAGLWATNKMKREAA